jgi:flagellar M-ring protein FliF
VLGKLQVTQLWSNVQALGARRIGILAAIGLSTFAAVAFGSHYLGRPEYEPLYIGLTHPDVARMGAALKDYGIPFDVSMDGTKILVRVGETARARALLAEKGLPNSGTTGYEIFDKLGAIGLTSFVQEVTRLRALEGELTRTILSLKGVKAARVHLVLPEQSALRRNRQTPSASIVVRTEVAGDASSGPAIRHLVAAAVPGLSSDNVRVLGTDGSILAGGSDGASAVPTQMVELEQKVGRRLQDNVRRTLLPYLGHENFEVSVTVRLNIDKRKVDETAFDPDTKVERSTRVVKESGSSQGAAGRSAVSVERNVPGDTASGQSPEQSRKANDRREEMTNFEINSRSTSTISEGYRIENIGVAVAVNRKLLAGQGAEAVSQEAIDKQMSQIERLASSAAGIDSQRGDRLTVSALDFLAKPTPIEVSGSGSALEMFVPLISTVLKSLTLLATAALLVWFGLRPAVKALAIQPPALPVALASATVGDSSASGRRAGELSGSQQSGVGMLPGVAGTAPITSDGIRSRMPQRRLEQLVSDNTDQASAVLKHWIRG